MTAAEILRIWPESLFLSILTWLFVAVLTLYFARIPAHRAIHSVCRIIHNAMRLTAQSLILAEKKLVKRNKEVLLTAGAEAVENLIEREFHRVDAVVKRDLSAFPVLQRSLFEQIKRIDDDYQASSELPPPPPDWIHAVEAVAQIPDSGNLPVATVLKEIHKTTTSQYKQSMTEYQKQVGKHHSRLNKLLPYWRKLTQTLDEVGNVVSGLHERSTHIDNRMAEYEGIRANTDKAQRTLTSSSLTQFFISGLVLLIAIGGAIINFNLIALPMSEMVGGGSYIGGFKTSDVAALVIILVEVAMGLYLMESLRITRLFPIIGQMDDKMRKKMVWTTLIILIILASIESSLALMRDQIAANNLALTQTLTGAAVEVMPNTWIPTVGQMVMGFILPFVLTFVAIPLESFVHSSRTVIGVVAAAILRFSAFFLRLSGNIIKYSGNFIVSLYDLLIFPALWLEHTISGFLRAKESGSAAEYDDMETVPAEEAVIQQSDNKDDDQKKSSSE